MTVLHGRNTQMLLQREVTFRTAPAAAAFKMKYSTVNMQRGQIRAEDPTITARPLMAKRDISDEAPSVAITATLDLNDIGQWLALLWGPPVTAGAGPYTHTFTLDLAARPSALVELGYIGASKYYRHLGGMVNALRWGVVSGDQNLEIDLITATEVDPVPSAAFDASPTEYAANRACAKSGNIYDVFGASTLGQISEGSVAISNDLEGHSLADALAGYGAILLGQPTISGELTALFEDAKLFDFALAHTSKALTLASANLAGTDTLTLTCPQVEFDDPVKEINTSKGLVVTIPWRAHDDATAPTIVLANSVASY